MSSKDQSKAQESKCRHNIVLVGIMGAGKSTVGKKIAQLSGFEFVDIDERVATAAGMSIDDIFAGLGEAEFRRLESEQLEKLIGRDNLVIATGGGIVSTKKNRDLIPKLGYVVWLHASANFILRRLGSGSGRPLLDPSEQQIRQTIARLLKKRRPHYRAIADLRVDNSELTISETAHGIAETARVFFATH